MDNAKTISDALGGKRSGEGYICGCPAHADRRADGSNPGKLAAEKAARAVNGKMAIPCLGKKADAWDVWKEQGPNSVRRMIEVAHDCR